MSDDKRTSSRRDFLKIAATGAPAAAALAVAEGASAAQLTDDSASEGLRRTEMTDKYYQTARF